MPQPGLIWVIVAELLDLVWRKYHYQKLH